MEQLKIGTCTIHWLTGGNTHLDGGAMFGVVPKALWSKKYIVNDKNQIPLRTDPVFIQTNGLNIIIDSGIGVNKLNEKQKRNFGVTEDSALEESLAMHGLKLDDINYVIMTHLHFDHASGLTKFENGEFKPVFSNAKIITSQIEWDEMRSPNIRSSNTYWKENWEAIQHQVIAFEKEYSLTDEITIIHTGGHSDGHSIIKIETEDELLLHMGDLMPTHAHQSPLWVMAYDDYPMTSIYAKEKWVNFGLQKISWFTFYHDDVFRAIKWSAEGQVLQSIERSK
ncbi:YtnP family quorum-quenching lactonase [Gottfriedia acidiceleris]|uniref:MBL fold metallo-hydrolase n=1 Tax=Gottfriedia acidiceleris TaxID=371036 RepID=A0ABY4JMC2_9BACI|nr:MBL fold metallo-hydrolase [Gottfriedia acidiceleris]UPM54986.1 MBL fold metallo-hydrolase [Gottfriedia acidiceleris]